MERLLSITTTFLAPLPRPLLKRIKKSGNTRLVLDCRLSVLRPILDQALEIGMMNQYFSYLITSLVRSGLGVRTPNW